MTVQELINRIEKLDQEREIKFHSYIERGRGGSWITVNDFNLEEEEDEILFSISGDEEDDGGYD